MPRNTRGVRADLRTAKASCASDDITQDPRYGQNAPHHGMPRGHLPVRSYLAAPVIRARGEVLGGLFFGHPEPGVFTERAERILAGIAAQAAIAIDNARLYQAAQNEIAERTKAQSALRDLNETLERRVIEAVADRDRLWELSEDLLVVADYRRPLAARESVVEQRRSAIDAAMADVALRMSTWFIPTRSTPSAGIWLSCARTGVPVRYENRFKRIDGTWRWIAWTLVARSRHARASTASAAT